MAVSLKPDQELLIGLGAAGLVYGVFALGVPNLADVRADEANMNTYKAVNNATFTAAAITATLGLLGRSPTIFILGGGMTLIEAWKYHFHNFGGSASSRNEQGQIG